MKSQPDAEALQAFLRTCTAARVEPLTAGPFEIYLDPFERKGPYVNYAIPAGAFGAATFAAAVPLLVAAFRDRGLLPSLEFVEAASPELSAALDAAGFAREPDSFAMTCAPHDLVALARSDDVIHLEADAPDDLMIGSIRVRKVSFEADESPPTAAEIAAFRSAPPAWNHAALRIDGTVVAAGSGSAVHAGWAEIAGIATGAPYRRRGYAGAVTAALARRAFAAGANTAFLTAADRSAASVYERAGFAHAPFSVAMYRLIPDGAQPPERR